jgi:nicotinate-nucleotide adenylyltransferase
MVKPLCLPTPNSLAQHLGGRLPPPGARIGLLGGSFNPAHAAHVQISEEALKRLGLDEVWWLVSPQNPLKSQESMAPLAVRLEAARSLARHPRIRATGIENALDTRFTVDTICALKARFPRVTFIWLMGADNLRELPQWRSWQEIFNEVAVAVFDRPPYVLRALSGKAARKFKDDRLREASVRQLGNRKAPAWVFLHTRRNPLSATAIRRREEGAGVYESQEGSCRRN